MEPKESLAALKGHAEIRQLYFGFADTMLVKCAVELRIADIIHTHGGPITLHQIASGIDSLSPDIPYLSRIMRVLVRRKVFTELPPLDSGETLYGLNHMSRWLLRDDELSLAPMVLMHSDPWLMAPWHYLSQCIKEGGIAFEKAHGCDMWNFASKNPEFNRLFNDAMASSTKDTVGVLLEEYKDGFESVGSLVDVGGGTGWMIGEIVKAHPNIKGINFDLPHVVATAPPRDGVSHVGGDMFEAIPSADAILMKRILHDWSDEDCIKILKNCREAIPQNSGKLIIVEIVLEKDGNDIIDDTRMVYDLVMMAHTTGGKERTEIEWKKLLEGGGFSRYKVTKIPILQSIIEAYLE